MDLASYLHQDSILHGVIEDINTKTPRQDPQKTCTRNSPCLQQECLTCSTPTNHVRNLDVFPTNHVHNLDVSSTNHVCNLDVSLHNINGLPNSATFLTSPTVAELPQPPNNHPISNLTAVFQLAIQMNDINDLKLLHSLQDKIMKSSLDYINYDRAALHTNRLTAIQLIDSHAAELPQPPTDHPILLLTAAYQFAIQENRWVQSSTYWIF